MQQYKTGNRNFKDLFTQKSINYYNLYFTHRYNVDGVAKIKLRDSVGENWATQRKNPP